MRRLAGALLALRERGRRWRPSVGGPPARPCTIPDQPFTLCATVTDDGEVARARVYFKPESEKFYSFVDMVFGGIEFCGTLPPPARAS